MLTGLAPLAHDARSWPFEQARNLLARVLRLRLAPDDQHEAARLFADAAAHDAVSKFPALTERPVRLETGYGPSGLPHLGTFQEVLRTTMVQDRLPRPDRRRPSHRADLLQRRHGRAAQGAPQHPARERA